MNDRADAGAPCADAAQDFLTRRNAIERELTLDLDGEPPLDLALGYDCGHRADNCAFELFVRRGACATFVGEVIGAPKPTANQREGLRELKTVFCGGRCACGELVNHTYAFDGARYVQTAQENCYCPKDPESEASDCRAVPPGTPL